MAQIKVFNPHPRLVNVALGNGKFIRILPNSEAEVDKALVQRLLDTSELTEGGKVETPEEEEDTKPTKRRRR